jgi:DnaJ domain/Protein of unknown function (DUF1232)
MKRLAAIVVCLFLVYLYLRSPIDLLPDRLGPIGFVDDLVVLGLGLWWVARVAAAAGGGGRATRDERDAPEAWDPWAVLGVEPGASREEIVRAYREQIKRHHPDRVADLGDDLRRLAHRKTVEIQRAYDEIGRA